MLRHKAPVPKYATGKQPTDTDESFSLSKKDLPIIKRAEPNLVQI